MKRVIHFCILCTLLWPALASAEDDSEEEKVHATFALSLGAATCQSDGDISCSDLDGGPFFSMGLQSSFDPDGPNTQVGFGVDMAAGVLTYAPMEETVLANFGIYGMAHVFQRVSDAMLIDISLGPGLSVYSLEESVPEDDADPDVNLSI